MKWYDDHPHQSSATHGDKRYLLKAHRLERWLAVLYYTKETDLWQYTTYQKSYREPWPEIDPEYAARILEDLEAFWMEQLL